MRQTLRAVTAAMAVATVASRVASAKSLGVALLLALSLGVISPAEAAQRPGAVTVRSPMPHAAMQVANGCFVETVAMLDAWQERAGAESWAKLLRWGAKEDEEVVAGHAVSVIEADGRLWCWDVNFGWSALSLEPAQRENIESVVVPIVARYARVTAQYPLYMADFAQPAGAPPASGNNAAKQASETAANGSLRDVLTVAGKLAKHRPVNVVTFTYGPDGARTPSAAAVFLYGGRYCVYVPELGTVPTRARGGVENLRLIQDILRRLCPGAGDVKKR